MFKLSYKELATYSIIGILILLLINIRWPNDIIVTTITAVIGSIMASVIISIIFQNYLHDSFNKYKKIGLRNIFDNFEIAYDFIKKDISKGKNIDIMFMFGNTFINNSSVTLKEALSKKNTKIRIFTYSIDNQYINSYGANWGAENSKYNKEGIIKLIKESKELLKNIYNKIPQDSRGSLEVYELINCPLPYSFYKIDNKLYYVPSKLTTDKLFKHPVFLFKKTNKKQNLYNSIDNEIQTMIANKEIIKIELI